jgi:hypothetical protein
MDADKRDSREVFGALRLPGENSPLSFGSNLFEYRILEKPNPSNAARLPTVWSTRVGECGETAQRRT